MARPTLPDVDLTDIELTRHGFPHELFTRLRREAPVLWHPLDDPLRVLRGVRLATEIPLRIEPDTWNGISRHAWRLRTLPGERVRDELFRLLALPEATAALERLRACGALAAVLPEALRGAGDDKGIIFYLQDSYP